MLFWTSVALQQTCHPYRDLSCGGYTDHFSHMNTARLFTEVGPAIWRQPLGEHGRPLTPAEVRALPDDLRSAAAEGMQTFEGWPADKPFVSSWNHNPRFHPPGDLLLTAPVALLYSATGLDFTGANTALIVLFMAYVHVPVLLVLRGALRPGRTGIGLLAGLLVYAELVHWALEGFYEGLLVAPLLLCARALHRGDGMAGLLWFSAAASLHFRAYFFAPWALYGLFLVLRRGQFRGRRAAALAVGTVVLSLASLVPFALLWPSLRALPVTSRVNPSAPDVTIADLVPLLLVVVVAAVALAGARAWLDLAVLGWVTLMLLSVREAYAWDLLSLLCWLVAPVTAGVLHPERVRQARMLVLLSVSVLVFGNNLAPAWLSQVL